MRPRVPPQLTLDVFAARVPGRAARRGRARRARRRSCSGCIGTAQIRRIPRRSWTNTRTEQAMVPIADRPPRQRARPTCGRRWRCSSGSGLDALLVGRRTATGALVTRRSAARLVHEKAEEQQREMLLATGGRPSKKGGRSVGARCEGRRAGRRRRRREARRWRNGGRAEALRARTERRPRMAEVDATRPADRPPTPSGRGRGRGGPGDAERDRGRDEPKGRRPERGRAGGRHGRQSAPSELIPLVHAAGLTELLVNAVPDRAAGRRPDSERDRRGGRRPAWRWRR